MADLEVELHKNLEQFEEQDRIDVLVTELSRARLDVNFLIIYRLIFGSQIRFLKLMRERGSFISLVDASSFFENLKTSEPVHSERSIEEFVQYLLNHELIVSHDEGFLLTSKGNDFLLFLYRSALPEDLPL